MNVCRRWATISPLTDRRRPGVITPIAVCALALTACSPSSSEDEPQESPTPVVTLDDNAALDERARELGIEDPPDVNVVREIAPDEYDEVIGTCMEAAGFPPASEGDQAGLSFNFPEDQSEQANLSLYICQSEHPIAARFQGGLSDEGARAMYRHLVESYVPCVAARGYAVADPPSLETYLRTPESDRWTPWLEVHAHIRAQPGSGGSISELETRCPPAPPTEELFPSG